MRKTVIFVPRFVLSLGVLAFCLCHHTVACAERTLYCAEEIAEFCKDVKVGEERLVSCLQEHEDGLSETCKTKLSELKQRLSQTQQACGADVERFCKRVHPGSGRIAKCLREHASELSPDCRHRIERTKNKMMRNKDAAH